MECLCIIFFFPSVVLKAIKCGSRLGLGENRLVGALLLLLVDDLGGK